MIQLTTTNAAVTPFRQKMHSPLTKSKIKVVGERGQVGQDGQDVRRREFDVRSVTLGDLFLGDSDVEIYLLERSNVVFFAVVKVFDRSHHPRFAREEVETGVLSSMRFRY